MHTVFSITGYLNVLVSGSDKCAAAPAAIYTHGDLIVSSSGRQQQQLAMVESTTDHHHHQYEWSSLVEAFEQAARAFEDKLVVWWQQEQDGLLRAWAYKPVCA